MKQIDIIIFCLFFYLANNQVPTGKVINTCGKVGYYPPDYSTDCVQPGEICCFVYLKNTPDGDKRFCVSAPSKITLDDVQDDIESYTNFKLHQLVCNDNSNFIKNTTIISLLLLFILF